MPQPTKQQLALLAQKQIAMIAAIGDHFGIAGSTNQKIVLADGSVHKFTINDLIEEVNSLPDAWDEEPVSDNIIDFPLAKQNNNTTPPVQA